MSTAFIITSCIEVKNEHPLTYSKTRSHFSSDERLRQTIGTVASLDSLLKSNTTMFLVDASENWEKYSNYFWYQPNLKFISVKNEFPEIFETVTSHPNKSYCECLILEAVMTKYRDELVAHDNTVKISGRYFLDSNFDSTIFDHYDHDRIFFKHPIINDWQDWWGYSMVDLRASQNDNNLRQYCSVLFGFGRAQFDYMLNVIKQIKDTLADHTKHHYDLETLSYFFTRDNNNIIHTNWIVYGFHGPDGRFVRY
jgi:hypothetical protein